MTQASASGGGNAPARDDTSDTGVPNGRNPSEGEADTEPSRAEKERLDREAGDVADDLADFA